jgi:hypothetical protein
LEPQHDFIIKEATADAIKSARQEKSKPILESLKIYLEEKQAGVLPKSHLGVGIAYNTGMQFCPRV